MQVDVRVLPPESFGAALLYFTGSKNHNVTLRQRALKLGYTLNEYDLVRMEDNKRMAGKTEEEIYKKLGLEYIPPELAGDGRGTGSGGRKAACRVDYEADIQGDVHMHTVETDGKSPLKRWRKRPVSAATIHGHHGPLQEPGLCQRTG